MADRGEIVLWALSEHIEPDAGRGDDEHGRGRLLGRRSRRSPLLIEFGFDCTPIEKEPGHGTSGLDGGHVDLVINIPREYDEQRHPDGYLIRRRAVDAGIPPITDLRLAVAAVEASRSKGPHELGIVAWGDCMQRRPLPLNELSGLRRGTPRPNLRGKSA